MLDMNLVEHALYAAAVQVTIGLLTGNWWAGAALAASYFIGREVAQAEYRWIEQFGGGLRANMPWHGAFDRRVWQNADQIADWLGPVVTTLAIAIVARQPRAGRSERVVQDEAADMKTGEASKQERRSE